MIIVVGHAVVDRDRVEQALALSLEHVRRSRAEQGCISHTVHRDVEDPLRLVFVERWADRASLARHFEVAESVAFVRSLAKLCTQPPGLAIYSAEELPTEPLAEEAG